MAESYPISVIIQYPTKFDANPRRFNKTAEQALADFRSYCYLYEEDVTQGRHVAVLEVGPTQIVVLDQQLLDPRARHHAFGWQTTLLTFTPNKGHEKAFVEFVRGALDILDGRPGPAWPQAFFFGRGHMRMMQGAP